MDYKKELQDLGFYVGGTVTFKNGKYSVDGDVELFQEYTKLPVQFDTVTGYFYCDDNNLTSLEGAPKTVGWIFNCSQNQLTSLDGALQKVGCHFYCSNNKLTNLDGGPKTVGRDFSCHSNPNLKSLDGLGKVGGKVYSGMYPCLLN